MPPRQPALPEGTDHVVRGASAEGESERRLRRQGRRRRSGTDRLVSQVRDQVTSLRGQAAERARGFADDGKGRVTGLLEDVSEVINDAARSVDERLGADYGDYAHRAADAVAGFAGRIRGKSVDDIIDDTRDFVRKSPAIAIGIAAVAGFALIRVIKTGLDDGARRPRRARSLSLDAAGRGSAQEESIGELIGRLIEDGRSYAEAELELVKAIAEYRALRARRALVAARGRLVLLVSSTTALVIGAVLWPRRADRRACWAGLIVGVLLAAAGYALVRSGCVRTSRAWPATRPSRRRSTGRRAMSLGEIEQAKREAIAAPGALRADARRGPAAAAARQSRRGGLGRGQGQGRRPRRRRAAGGQEPAQGGFAGAGRARRLSRPPAAETGGEPPDLRRRGRGRTIEDDAELSVTEGVS